MKYLMASRLFHYTPIVHCLSLIGLKKWVGKKDIYNLHLYGLFLQWKISPKRQISSGVEVRRILFRQSAFVWLFSMSFDL